MRTKDWSLMLADCDWKWKCKLYKQTDCCYYGFEESKIKVLQTSDTSNILLRWATFNRSRFLGVFTFLKSITP